MALRWIDRLVPHQLTRDLAMLFRSLGSDKAPPFAMRGVNGESSASDLAHQERPSFYDLDPSFDTFESPSSDGSFASSVNQSASSAKAYTRRLRVSEVRRETADAVSLVLVDPTGEPIAFQAGQFFTIAHQVDGRVVKRAYSASSSALDPASVSITIKRVDGGLVSNSINDSMAAGHHLEVLGPSGSFVVPSHANDLVLVGGGSGITPLMSIAKTTLASRADARVTLIFGNRSPDDVIFARDIEALSSSYSQRFVVRHVVEVVRPEHGDRASTFRVGRLDEDTLASELEEAALRSEAHFFVCGPEVVMDAAERVLRSKGVDASRIRSERFSSLRAAAHADVPEEVTVFIEGRRFSLTVPPSETILEAAMRTSLPMPFSCTVGGCGACRVRLLAGDVALDEPNCLDAEERRQGYVLACVSRPLGPVTLEVE